MTSQSLRNHRKRTNRGGEPPWLCIPARSYAYSRALTIEFLELRYRGTKSTDVAPMYRRRVCSLCREIKNFELKGSSSSENCRVRGSRIEGSTNRDYDFKKF